jgi:LPXTG-motif cell wall-anchored protein
MKTKIIVSICICALGLAVAIAGYLRMHDGSGQGQSIAATGSDSGMVLLWAGASLALLGGVLTVFAAIRARD